MERTFKATLKIEGFHAQDVEITVHDAYSSEPDKMLLATIKAWVKRVSENPYYVLFRK